MSPAEQVTAKRATYVEKLDAIGAQLSEARAQLTAAEVAYRTEQDAYEAMSLYVMTPLARRDKMGTIIGYADMPSATHAWLHGEAKAPLTEAQAALRALKRLIESLEQDLSKWADEVAYLDRVLAGDKSSSVRLVVPRPKAPVVEFDNIAPRERTA